MTTVPAGTVMVGSGGAVLLSEGATGAAVDVDADEVVVAGAMLAMGVVTKLTLSTSPTE